MYGNELKRYLDDLAGKKPAPGGGSAAALAAAIGVGLISMVANFTVGKERYRDVEEEMKEILSSAEVLRERLLKLVDEDVAAYKRLSEAYKLPKENNEAKRKREQAIQRGLKEALSCPFEICKCCLSASRLCPMMTEKGNINLLSDVGVAILLLEAAFESALVNVDINLKGIQDDKFILEVRRDLEPMEKEITAIAQAVDNKVKRHLTK